MILFQYYSFFFFNDTATTEIYTLSLHDALPIFLLGLREQFGGTPNHLGVMPIKEPVGGGTRDALLDRKSTRLNSSHVRISYAVFCLKKKKYSYILSLLYFLHIILSIAYSHNYFV